jgi:hypothetical protein
MTGESSRSYVGGTRGRRWVTRRERRPERRACLEIPGIPGIFAYFPPPPAPVPGARALLSVEVGDKKRPFAL